jgi:hypothetical protein
LCSDLGVSRVLDLNSFLILDKAGQTVLEAYIQGGVYMIKSILKHLSVWESAFAVIHQISLFYSAQSAQEDHSGDLSTPTRDDINPDK